MSDVTQTLSQIESGNASAAEAMRRILIGNARRKKSLKARGAMTRVKSPNAADDSTFAPEDLLARDESLTMVRLAALSYLATLMTGCRVFVMLVAAAGLASSQRACGGEKPGYDVDLIKAHSGYDRTTCWVHARAGAIPTGIAGNPGACPIVILTTQKALLTDSDVFYRLHELRTEDLGNTWSPPRPEVALARQRLDAHREIVVCDFTPRWHAATGKLLGTGHTITYYDNAGASASPESWAAYSAYDPVCNSWAPWQKLQLPAVPKFLNAGAGCSQRYDLPNGEILLPIYFRTKPSEPMTRATVLRCRFDGTTLSYVEHGDELAVDTCRGLAEPSLTKFGDRFYLTLRHDERGYVTAGTDGLHFDPLIPWKFDDGSELGTYNTQQHWVTHSDGLFLVYTRRGAHNNHILRHRAPLFMAQVDPQRMCVLRSTERILVPQRGARLGNFGVVDVTPNETWVVAAEWMQSKVVDPERPLLSPLECEKYGSDNSIFVARLRWHQPNRLMAPRPANDNREGGTPTEHSVN